MEDQHVNTAKQSAEVSGIALRFLSGKHLAKLNALLSKATTVIGGLYTSDLSRFIVCLQLVHLNFPPLVDRFLNELFYVLPRLHGKQKAFVLEMLNTRSSSIPTLYTTLKPFLSELLHSSEPLIARYTVMIMKSCVEKGLSEKELTTAVALLCPLVEKDLFDSAALKTVIEIFEYLHDEELFCGGAVRTVLLKGLSNAHAAIRAQCLAFWSNRNRLSSKLKKRMGELLETMYCIETEDEYVSYCCALLLDLCEGSPDYERALFDAPLSKCNFEVLHVDPSWQKRNYMTSLYASTQLFRFPASSSTGPSSSARLPSGMLRATPLSTNLLDLPEGPVASTPGALGFSLPDDSVGSPSVLYRNDYRTKFLQQLQNSNQQKLADPLHHLRIAECRQLKRRFNYPRSGSEASSFLHTRIAHKKRDRRRLQDVHDRLAQQHSVSLFRKYRTGDLPDIQIKYRDLIAPLKRLVQMDNYIARRLLACIVHKMVEYYESTLPARAAEEAVAPLAQKIQALTGQASLSSPMFVAFLLDICYHVEPTSIAPGTLGHCGRETLNQHLAIMLLEKQLSSGGSEPALPFPKRSRVNEGRPPSLHKELWFELAKLYKSIQEYDVIRGILASNFVTSSPVFKEAIEAEAQGDYSLACDCYDQLHSGSVSDNFELNFVESGLLKSLEMLGKWPNVKTRIDELCGYQPNFWKRLWELNDLDFVSQFVKAHLKCTAGPPSQTDDRLRLFIAHSLQDRHYKPLMRARFGVELALFFVVENEHDRARYFCREGLHSFLEDWKNLPHLKTSSRQLRLANLQPLVEIEEFLIFLSTHTSSKNTTALAKLLSRWAARLPHKTSHQTDVWDDLISYRFLLLNIALNATNVTEEQESLIVESKVSMLLKASAACRHQQNFSLGMRYQRQALACMQQMSKENRDYVATLHSLTKLSCAKAKCHLRLKSHYSSESAAASLLKALGDLKNFSSDDQVTNDPLIFQRHCLLKCRVLGLLEQLFRNPSFNIGKLDPKLLNFVSGAKAAPHLHQACLEEYYSSLQHALKSPKGGCGQYAAKLHLTMAKFCDKALSHSYSVPVPANGPRALSKLMISSVFQAMHLGSNSAASRVPRLLHLLAKDSQLTYSFRKECEAAPCWMFIPWISQLVAILSKTEAAAVIGPLKKIGKFYPQALFYPLRLCSKHDYETVAWKYVEELQALSHHPYLDRMIKELRTLVDPEHLFKDWYINDLKPLFAAPRTLRNENRIMKEFSKMKVDLLSMEDCPSDVRKRFALEYGPQIEKLAGVDGARLLAHASNDPFGAVLEAMQQRSDFVARPETLKEYSLWLASYHSSNFKDHPIEVPGQYTGRCKPIVESHTKICAFDDRIKVLMSMRKPKRLLIRGDDEREYMFLVKGGEDLRLDQRLQQLFTLMNEALYKDTVARQRSLYLQTYQVIPVSLRLGLIEWIKETITLKELLETALTSEEKSRLKSPENNPIRAHINWINRFKTKKADENPYTRMYMLASNSETTAAFRHRRDMVPRDLLRRAILKRINDREAFVAIRSDFIRSHATLSICHYVLGIGDRHLSNFMFNLSTGRIIGIDFGHAFGSATQFLPVPELIPFRLTPQIVGFLYPLTTEGLLRNSMIITMNALRRRSAVLLRTLDVFVNEPLFEWRSLSRGQAGSQAELELHAGVDHIKGEWYPREKLSIAEQKLESHNSSYIMALEIKAGHGHKKECEALLRIVQGDPNINVRAKVGAICKNVEEQVDCLIDHATDPNILGRLWVGWESYM
ncbi:DNA-dependent protein kinase catalytic subunit-like isoform X2 [Zophobas morio]|uniref:DNA-dependent protein kinase catalytic subunit-like isoform X2 n=1 Tax=Zophobas morio TaxID=2755281 RepID=UPI003082EC5D